MKYLRDGLGRSVEKMGGRCDGVLTLQKFVNNFLGKFVKSPHFQFWSMTLFFVDFIEPVLCVASTLWPMQQNWTKCVGVKPLDSV